MGEGKVGRQTNHRAIKAKQKQAICTPIILVCSQIGKKIGILIIMLELFFFFGFPRFGSNLGAGANFREMRISVHVTTIFSFVVTNYADSTVLQCKLR